MTPYTQLPDNQPQTDAAAPDAGGSTAAVPPVGPSAEDTTIKTVILDFPIHRGNQMIGSITVRKPRAGALRGVTLVALTQIDVSALQTVLPRIAEPALTAHEIANMDPADLMSLGAAVSAFFFTKADRAAYQIA
ncbi:Phage tail protein E [compost metagenome]